MDYQNKHIKIVGMSAAVPKKRIENISNSEDKKELKLFKMTGIFNRHVIETDKARLVDYAIVAARDAIEKSMTDLAEIKYIIYITQHPEFAGPSTSFYIQKELNIEKNCMVFDINLGCSGFVAGLQIASSLISQMTNGSKALLINAENLSSVKRENANDMYLFGDAASAVIIEKDDRRESVYLSDYYSDGSRYKAIYQESLDKPCSMDGQAVFEFSIYEVSKYIKAFLEKNQLTDEKIDHIVFHQAQKFITDHMATNAKLNIQKMLYSLDEYANTSGVSIPLSICKNKDVLQERGKYLISGFGVGLAWGVAYLEIEKKAVFGIAEF